MTETLIAKPQYTLDHNQETIAVSVALPEVNKDSIKLSSEKSTLSLIAERSSGIDPSWQLLDGGQQASGYELEIEIDSSFDLSRIEAKFINNQLNLVIPKVEPYVRNIAIE